MSFAVTLLIPPALTLILGIAVRRIAGERAHRLALLPLAVGVLLAWIAIVRPGWMPVDDVRRVVHISVGAALLGLVIDAAKPPRIVAALLSAFFLLGSAHAAVTGALMPQGSLSAGVALMVAAAAGAAFLIIARFDAMRERAVSLAVLLTALALGLSGLAAIASDAAVLRLALMLFSALAGYLVLAAVTGAAASDGVVVFSGAALLALVWALAARHPDLRIALACLPLVLFAEATALKVPLPAARVSSLLYPLMLAALTSLPLLLAGLIAFVTTRP